MQKQFFSAILTLLVLSFSVSGQEQPRSVRVPERADSLLRAYRFEEALQACQPAGEAVSEKTLNQIRSAISLSDQCANPRVVARQKFSRADYFLYYPLPAGAWHPSPSPLDREGTFPVYLKDGDDVVYFSARDAAGARSLFLSEDRDSLWRTPRHLSESLLSLGSEVFPMLSANGRTLYFASDGMNGMGGLDIYASAWDDANAIWGEPVNLGFPYNSPWDDFLMADSEDGKYTVFASNRDCGTDSLYVYVVEYEESPLRTPVKDPDELKTLCTLEPSNAASPRHRTSCTADTRLYMRKMAELRTLRDSLYRRETDLDALRARLVQAAETEAEALKAQILERETALSPLRRRIASAREEIRRVESAFLRRGSATQDPASATSGADTAFHFEKRPMGLPLDMTLEQTGQTSLFSVDAEGHFSPDAVLPEGVVYQFFLCTSAARLSVQDLNGLSPVYERLNANLRYAYFAGLFPTYRAALLHLNQVRKAGFPQARIVAYSDGRSIPVNQARQEE